MREGRAGGLRLGKGLCGSLVGLGWGKTFVAIVQHGPVAEGPD